MNRRAFLGTLGVFSILPGAGRVWRAVRPAPWYFVSGLCNYNDYEAFCSKEPLAYTHGWFIRRTDGKTSGYPDSMEWVLKRVPYVERSRLPELGQITLDTFTRLST